MKIYCLFKILVSQFQVAMILQVLTFDIIEYCDLVFLLKEQK